MQHPSRLVYTEMMAEPPVNTVLSLRVTGTAAACGCAANRCCGAPEVPKIAPQYFIPDEAAAFLNLGELNAFIREVNTVQENNYIPPIPLMFTHFCLPFSPVCVMSCFESSRNRMLRELVDKTNQQTLVPRGCHWELMSSRHCSHLVLHLVAHHSSQSPVMTTAFVASHYYDANNQQYPGKAAIPASDRYNADGAY